MDSVLARFKNLATYLPWVARLVYYQFSDPCRGAGGEVVSYAAAMLCYNSFPLTYATRKGTIGNLRKVASMDGYGRDLEGRIEQLDSWYDKEHEFQRDAMVAFHRMQGGGLQYLSQCFTTFEFSLPFSVALVDGGLVLRDVQDSPWRSTTTAPSSPSRASRPSSTLTATCKQPLASPTTPRLAWRWRSTGS